MLLISRILHYNFCSNNFSLPFAVVWEVKLLWGTLMKMRFSNMRMQLPAWRMYSFFILFACHLKKVYMKLSCYLLCCVALFLFARLPCFHFIHGDKFVVWSVSVLSIVQCQYILFGEQHSNQEKYNCTVNIMLCAIKH